MTPTLCRSCNAPILWATVWSTGAKIPLDQAWIADDDATDSDFLLVKSREGPPLAVQRGAGITGHKIGLGRAATYRTHFATCPSADEHRRR